MRKLAHVEKIGNIQLIDGSDNIVKATILGWDVIVKKDEFKIGDSCIYIETDSKMKEIEIFEFLRSRNFKIKIAKIRGVESYGIVFPLYVLGKENVLEDGYTYDEASNSIVSNYETIKLEEGTDLTSVMGIVKYDTEEGESLEKNDFKPNPKKSKFANMISFWKYKIFQFLKRFDNKSKGGSFPSEKYGIKKSDEDRIQSFGEAKKESLKGKSFTKFRKMDGSSMTVIKHKKDFVVCSRNLALGESKDNKFWLAVYKYDLRNKMKKLGRNLAIQVELIGEKIQDNKYGISGHEIRMFLAYDTDKKRYLTPKESIEISKLLDIPHAEAVDTNFVLNHTVEELIEESRKMTPENPLVHEEGFVYVLNDSDMRVSFKVINPNYLLEKEEKEKKGKKDKQKKKEAKQEFNENKEKEEL
jgi:RNA ligase (TIGR02306 family)